MSSEASGDAVDASTPTESQIALHSPGYLSLLAVAALVGIPISAAAFAFLAAVHKLEHWVWHTLPHDLGFDGPPAWWPIAALGLAGLLVALAVTRLPGGGGHVPAEGLHAGPTPPSVVPGVMLAAGASLVLGAVVGPEAPLIAIGGGLALLAVRRTKAASDAQATAIVSASGSAAAVSAIFGNPLVAGVLFLEAAGLGRRQSTLMILPCLVSSGVGGLVFTGLGNWSGLGIGALAIPDLVPAQLHPGELAWALPLAVAIAVGTSAVFVLGRATARAASQRVVIVTTVVGLLAGCSAAVYAVLTDHSPTDVALSGQATLATLATSPAEWSAGALVLLLVCKGVAYALCIGVFRGGPVFPALFLGAAAGVLASMWLPGISVVAGVSIGMAAGSAVTGLPVTGILLVVLLLGDAAGEHMPVIILATVVALIVEELLTTTRLKHARPAAGHT